MPDASERKNNGDSVYLAWRWCRCATYAYARVHVKPSFGQRGRRTPPSTRHGPTCRLHDLSKWCMDNLEVIQVHLKTLIEKQVHVQINLKHIIFLEIVEESLNS